MADILGSLRPLQCVGPIRGIHPPLHPLLLCAEACRAHLVVPPEISWSHMGLQQLHQGVRRTHQRDREARRRSDQGWHQHCKENSRTQDELNEEFNTLTHPRLV